PPIYSPSLHDALPISCADLLILLELTLKRGFGGDVVSDHDALLPRGGDLRVVIDAFEQVPQHNAVRWVWIPVPGLLPGHVHPAEDRKSTRLNSSHVKI